MSTILLTGGAGFIGSNVADKLLANNHKVVIVDNLCTGRRENLPAKAEFHCLDISDPKVGELFKTYNFDAVIHHAAQIDVRISMKNPSGDASINVVGSLKLLEHCIANKVKKFIFASTGGAIYGEQDYFPADEKHPVHPLSIYGVDKLAVENYLYVFHQAYGLDVVCLRYANVYGPRQNPLGEAGVVAIFSNKLLHDHPATIYGDGLQTRDYVFVGDIARINLMALELSGYNIINAGTSVETSVVELYEKLGRLTAAPLTPAFIDPPAGEVRRSCIDYTHATKTFGWKPEVNIDEGLARTLEWFKANL